MDQQSNSVLQTKVEEITQSIKQGAPKFEQTVKGFERSGNILWALFLIFLGIIFLCNNIGLIPWSVWSYLWRFWPLLLIIGGIQAILGNSFISRLIIGGLVVVLFMGIFFTALAVSNESLLNNWGITIPEWWKSIAQSIGNRKESIYEIKDEDYTKVIDRVIMVDIGIGEFNITDDITSSYITINSNYYENYGEPQFTESFEDSKLTIDLKQQSNFNWGFNMSGPKYTLNLGQPDVNTDFNIKLGAGSGSLNLTSLVTKSLIAEVGAGSLNIDLSKDSLPSNGGTIKVGTGEVVIIVPESIGYKIKYKVGLGSFTINGEKINKGISDNQTYQSENYTKAANKLEINVEVGVGSFKLETE